MKKLLSFFVSLTMILSSVTGVVFAENAENGVEFFDAVNDAKITEISGEENLYAKIIFDAEKSGMASVIAARYSDAGALLNMEVVDEITISEIGSISYTTPLFSVSGTDELKIFVWDSLNGLVPLLENPGAIRRTADSFNDISKFTGKTDASYVTDTDVKAGDLFEEIENIKPAIDGDNVQITVTTISGNASGTYTADTADWTNGTITFTGVGDVSVAITDNYYCTPTVIGVTIEDYPTVDKFAAKENLTFERKKQDESVVISLGDVFEEVAGASINSANVTVDIDGENCVYTADAADWTKGTLIFTGTGDVKISITDNDYCNTAVATVTITEPEMADKFIPNDNLTFTHTVVGGTITKTLGELFTVAENAEINTDGIHVEFEGDNIYTYTQNANWADSTIEFKGTGKVTITITDDNFCNDSVAVVVIEEPQSVEKFKAKDNLTFTHTVEGGTITKTTGDIFEAISEDIHTDKIEITVSGNCVYTPGDSWDTGTLAFTGIGDTIIEITDNNFCKQTTATVTVQNPASVDKFTTKFENSDDYLYRVGNQNTVALGSLFETLEGAEIGDVKVTVIPKNGTVSGTYTENTTDWTKGTIQFANTGIVQITIDDNKFANEYTLLLEVVDAKNTTTASFSGNSVLLNDVSTASTLGASGVVYGNGFTVNMENAPISEKNGAVFHLYDGAVLKNLKIVGKEFTTVATNVNDTNYGVSAVRAWGNVVIENCYISGCRAAVSVTGSELTIKDSVIANGVYANVDFRSGILNLHNVTTVNEPHAVNGTTIVGLGIVGNLTASAGRELNITGTLTQYNWVSKADCENIKATGIDSIFNSVFSDDAYASLRYTYNGTTYVNTGILSLCSDFGASAVSGIPADYSGMNVAATVFGVSADGYVWAPAQAGTLSDDDMKYHDTAYDWTPSEQGTSYIAPAFNFGNTDLETENGVVQISYENGSSYTLSAETLGKLLNTEKYGQSLPCKISMDGTDYTGKDIVLNDTSSKTYTITYTVIDNLVYDKDGNKTDKTFEVQKELKVFATVVDKSADAPVFTFYYGTNGSASAGTPHVTQPTTSYTSTIKQIGDTYYIMPNVNATTANAIGSQIIDGQTVYYPIVDGINVRSGNQSDFDFTRYYPVFKAVKISDNGTEYSYSGTKTMPDTVIWSSAVIDSGNGASTLNDGFGLYNNQYLCRIQKKAGNAESGGTSVVTYSYTALDGNTYYYYVGYRFYDEAESESCVVEGTLITLADGTIKPVEELAVGDMIMVFNHVSGVNEAAPLIFNTHGDAEARMYDVLHLQFENGEDVEIVQSHGFFDTTLMQYVYINYDNYMDYIGHEFYKNNGTRIKLTNGYIEKKMTRIFCPVTYFHMNSYANGFLNTPNIPGDITGLVNYFEYDPDLKYNEEAMQKDIEKYGLYTYDDFSDYISYEAYLSSPSVYLKVAVGKDMITYDEIVNVIKYLLAGSLIQ